MTEKSAPLTHYFEVHAANESENCHSPIPPPEQRQILRQRRSGFVVLAAFLLLPTAAILTYSAYSFALFVSACNNSGNAGVVMVVDHGPATTGSLRKRNELSEGQMAGIAGCVFFLLVVVGASVWMLHSRQRV
jgi:hypothetical protein